MKASKFLNVLIMTILLVSPLTVPVSGAPSAVTAPEGTLNKIEPLVLKEITAEGKTELFVWMVEKADLSPAYQLGTKQEKGRFVFNALVETAERTQKDLRAYLDAQGVEYQAFYIANKILVRNGGQALVMDLAARGDVVHITANHKFQLDEPFSSPASPSPQAVEPNITFINADDVWAMGYDGSGTVLAGNDTGLDETHPTIAPHYRGCLNPPTCTLWDHNYNWWDATGTYPTHPYDGHGHGTHTTGTMVGDDGGTNQIGVAPGAQTVHCKNMTDDGSGDDGTFTECFQWDLAPWDLSGQNPDPDLAPDAVNNSWGYEGGNNPVFEDEIAALQAAGIAVEVSAGNEGPGCYTLRSLGDYSEVLTTGSVNHAGGVLPGTLTGFSSRGPSDLYPGQTDMPDIMAPGESIRSALPGNSYGWWSGTSMAGPHATALVGLMWSACPSLQGMVDRTIDIIRSTAVPLTGQNGSKCGGDHTTGPNNDWGFGTIDAQAAVNVVLAQCTGLGALDGTVAGGMALAAIEGATVTAEWDAGGSWNQDTDASGYYTMAVPNGTYTVSVEHPLYTTVEVYEVVVTTHRMTTNDFVMKPKGRLYGYVTDFDNGFPLEATVTADDGTTVDTNPATGYYEMYLDEGSYLVTASAQDYADGMATVDIVSGQDAQRDLALEAAVGFVPTPLHVTLDWQTTDTADATLMNRMPEPYDFEFLEVLGGFIPLVLDGSGEGAPAGNVTADWPGPDGFGYEGEQIDYEWVDISGTGTAVYLNCDDCYGGPFDLGFTFPYYGADWTQLYVGSNGQISFGSGYDDYSHPCPLPDANSPNSIVPLWSDLRPEVNNAPVYYESFDACPVGGGACMVVTYDNYYYVNGSVAGTWEAILFENGSVLVQFLDAGAYSGDITVTGIQGNNVGGDHGLTYACDTSGMLYDELAICFVYPGSSGCLARRVPWLGEDPIVGTVPASGMLEAPGMLDVTMYFSATHGAGVDQPGDYFADLRVNGDPILTVRVTMTVLAPMDMGKVEGFVLDSCTGEPVEATLDIAGGDPIAQTMSDPDSGYYAAWLEEGNYDGVFSADGYLDYDATLDVTAGQTTTLDVNLVPDRPCISVEPDMLEAWVPTGILIYSHPTGLDILNDGGQDLEYDIREISGTTTMLSLGGLELGALPEGVNTDDPAAFPAVATERNIAANPVVIIQDQYPWGYDSINQVLNANGIAYDMATSGDIPTIDLSQYELVIIPSNQTSSYYTVFNANIAKFESYVAAGGKLWMSTCAYSGTSPEPLVPGGVVNATELDSYNNVVLTGHPWVQGVPHPFSGDYASHDSLTNLVPGTLEICEAQGSGKATLLEYDLGVGHLAVTGQTLELAWASGWDGAPILDQSLLYMYAYDTGGDVPWIWEDPASDTVPARPFTAEMQNVDIYFTAVVTDPLPLGTYTATLKVLNNDPVAGIQDVLVLMHIVEEHLAPTASFESNSPVREGTEVVFTNTTTVGIPPETDYLWDFGDGETSAEFEPTHIYAEPGTYDVTLEACSLAGMCDTYADTVGVIGYYYLPLIQKNYE